MLARRAVAGRAVGTRRRCIAEAEAVPARIPREPRLAVGHARRAAAVPRGVFGRLAHEAQGAVHVVAAEFAGQSPLRRVGRRTGVLGSLVGLRGR